LLGAATPIDRVTMPKNKCAIYTRVSTGDQNIENQLSCLEQGTMDWCHLEVRRRKQNEESLQGRHTIGERS